LIYGEKPVSQTVGISKRAQYLRSQVVAQQSRIQLLNIKPQSSVNELFYSNVSKLPYFKHLIIQTVYFFSPFFFSNQKLSAYFRY